MTEQPKEVFEDEKQEDLLFRELTQEEVERIAGGLTVTSGSGGGLNG